MSSREIVLDTETTGLEIVEGHRVIEIGCLEMVGRRLTGRRFHHYLNPDRHIDSGALEVHGITAEFLQDKPCFADIVEEFLEFIEGARLIIHNAEFDIEFLNNELSLFDSPCQRVEERVEVVDTLLLARQLHPGMKNTLDALCKRYGIDNSNRTLHGALLDAELLADVYLAMTGGQSAMSLELQAPARSGVAGRGRMTAGERPKLPVIRASAGEVAAHSRRLQRIQEASRGGCVWLRLETESAASLED